METVKPPYLVLLPQIDMGQASCLTAVQFVSRADAFDHAAEVAVELLMKGLQPKDPTEAGAWADARSALKATVLDELNLSGYRYFPPTPHTWSICVVQPLMGKWAFQSKEDGVGGSPG